jgi:hypothetical protein
MAKTRGSLKISSEGQGNDIKEDILYYFETKDQEMKLKSKKIVFARYEKPKELKAPSKTEFATNHAESRGTGGPVLPFRGLISKTLAAGPNDDPDEIIYEVDGKTHSKNCYCNTCWKNPGETISDVTKNLHSNVVQEYNDKFVDEYAKQFKVRLESVESQDIQNETEEQLEEIMFEMSHVIMEYKEDLLGSQPPELNYNYMTIIQQYLDAMKEIVTIANTDFEEKEINEKADIEYETSYGRDFDSRDMQASEDNDPDLRGWKKTSTTPNPWDYHKEVMGFHTRGKHFTHEHY